MFDQTLRSNVCQIIKIFYFVKHMGKSWSSKYGQKLLDSAKRLAADAYKTESKMLSSKSRKSIWLGIRLQRRFTRAA